MYNEGKHWIILGLLAITLLGVAFLDTHAQQPIAQGEESEFGTEGVWKTYRYVDGLASNQVLALLQDKEGAIWVGTSGGVSRFDGVSWKTYTIKNGLADNRVYAILQDKEGAIWFGTSGGVSRFDGKGWKRYTIKDGLASNDVTALLQDKEGTNWFGTDGGGVSQFDGRCFQTIDSRDGLVNDNVRCVYEDRNGQIWIGTEGGVVQFIPNRIPPPVYITQVLADEMTYPRPGERLNLRAGVRRVAFDFHAISSKTRPGGMKYFYQLVGQNADWQGPTNQETVEYFNLKPGEYTFKVQAVDRDLNYSEPASLDITIPPPPFYKSSAFVLSLSMVGSLLAIAVIGLSIKHWQTRRQLAQQREEERKRLKEEMDEARQMQLSLLPEGTSFPEGYDIAGFSEPAREVGGDFYDYLQLDSHRFGIALADVSGKGLQAAMHAVLTNGMLHEVAKTEQLAGNLLSVLNTDLYPRMQRHKFTALQLGILDPKEQQLSYANAGLPLPILKRGAEVQELEASGLPLGMMRGEEYNELNVELQAGDFVIFYTDGIDEAVNEAEEMYSFERLKKIIKQADSEICAEEMIRRIVLDVKAYVGDAEQYDDMTIVVLRCLR